MTKQSPFVAPSLRRFVASAALFGLATASPAQPTIEGIAPENSVVVAGIGSTGKTLDRFKQTSLWKLWRSDHVQDIVKNPMAELQQGIQDALRDLGIDDEEGEQQGFPRPQGPVGLAIFPVAAGPEQPSIGYLALADYGSEAPRMGRIADALLEKARQDGVEVREQEMLGRTVYSFPLSDPEAAAGDEQGFGLEGEEAFEDFEAVVPMPVPDVQEFFESMGHVHYCRDASRFLLCSNPESLRRALESIDENTPSGLATRPDFTAAMRQLGTVDGYALLLVRDLATLAPPDDPTFLMIQGMVKSIVGDIRALGLGVRVGTDEAMVEESFAVYMPAGKTGLSSLVDAETPMGALPPFVGPQTVVYSRGNVRFSGIVGFLRGVAQSNPLIGVEINRMLTENGPTIERVCAALGPKFHSMMAVARPINLDSLKSLYAIECSKPGDVESVLAEHAADWGLRPRDFMGNRIYTMDFNLFPMAMAGPFGEDESLAIGLGGGHMFIGSPGMVEDALRAGARKGGPTLAEDPEFKRAMKALKSPRAVGWGVMNLASYLEFLKEFEAVARKHQVEQAMQWDPEFARQLGEEQPPWEDFDPKVLARYLGPVCWEFRSREDGFSGRYLMLPPAAPATAKAKE